MQILFVAVVLAEHGVGLNLHGAPVYLGYVVGLTTLLSGAGYLTAWLHQMASMEDTR